MRLIFFSFIIGLIFMRLIGIDSMIRFIVIMILPILILLLYYGIKDIIKRF